MSRTALIIGVLLSIMIVTGCAAPPWSAVKKSDIPPQQPSPDKSTTAQPAAAKPNIPNQQAPAANSQANAQAMLQIMQELQQLGTLDPAAQNKLMEDLKQTDPTLWPLVMQQFRAAIAYKRRSAERDSLAASTNTSASGSVSTSNAISSTGNQTTNISSRPAVAQDTQSTPNASSKEVFTAAAKLSDTSEVKHITTEEPAKETSKAVINASYNAPISREPGNLQDDLAAAIKTLESAQPSNSKSSEEIAQQVRLRMLYAMAGRRDDALKPIASAPPPMQEFWTKEMYGLATLMDAEKTPDITRRASESKQILTEAVTKLSETAPLVAKNLNFCTAIQSYGCYTVFKKYEFAAEQEALLYAEIDNFASESTPKGFHTQLKSSYQILDSTGQRIAEHSFTTTEEYCQNARRDFFIGYHLRMPKRINPGKYTLQLTVEDLVSQKVGQSTIDFTIKDAEK